MVTIVKTDSGLPCDFPCIECDGTGEVEMTNEYFLQTATTEELAEWICSVHEKCYYCGAKRISDRERCPFSDGKCRNNKHEFAMWLKQPHNIKE
jgi:hypothetical protein